MPYIPANVPKEYNASFMAEELQRIANAYNSQESLGLIAFDPANAPHPQQTIGIVAEKLENFDLRGPREDIGDGPIQMDPRVHPDNEIEILLPGVYVINFYFFYDHVIGADVIFEVFRDGVATTLGAGTHASQQTDRSTITAAAMFSAIGGEIIDMRARTDAGTELIEMQAGTLSLFKIRDLRTRFS